MYTAVTFTGLQNFLRHIWEYGILHLAAVSNVPINPAEDLFRLQHGVLLITHNLLRQLPQPRRKNNMWRLLLQRVPNLAMARVRRLYLLGVKFWIVRKAGVAILGRKSSRR